MIKVFRGFVAALTRHNYSTSNNDLYTAVGSINRVDNEGDKDPFPNQTGICTVSKVRLETAPTGVVE